MEGGVKMKVEKLTGMVREALQLPKATVKNLGRVGGMTNLNYLVEINSEPYIVRIPGNGTKALINRVEEEENLKLGSDLGINPELVYFNASSGLKITRKIENAQTLTQDTAKGEEMLVKAAEIFKKLHHSTKKMGNQFKLFEMMAHYETLALRADGDFYSGFEKVKEQIKELQYKFNAFLIVETPCHIDPACSNFILDDEGRVYLIDWEYGGMFDPMWDVAAFALESGLSKSEEAKFHSYYFQREVTAKEQERILLHKIFQDYLWSLWTVFKEEKGDDFGLYGYRRFERAKTNIELYYQIYEVNYNAQ